MIDKIIKNTKGFINRSRLLFLFIKPLSNIVRIILDKRYFYHYLQGVVTDVRIRRSLARIEAYFYKSEARVSEKTDLLRNNSYVENPLVISGEKVREIRESLRGLKCQDQLDDSLRFDVSYRPKDCNLAFYDGTELFKLEPIIELAVDEALIDIYNDLYGCDPIIDHIAAWWTFPSDRNHDTQYWHRDIDTLNLLKFLVYLTDVDLDSGAHFLIPGSHNSQVSTAKYRKHRNRDFETIIEQHGTKAFVGPAGTNFLENTFAFHKGTNPKEKPRLLLEVIYSRVATPFTDKKPFIHLDESRYSSLIRENISLFKGKIVS